MLYIVRILFLLMYAIPVFAQDTLFVVEREREKVAIIDKSHNIKEIDGLGNLNHATIKFSDKKAYVLSRDGHLTKFDKEKVLKKVSIGKSGIGFTFIGQYIAVANYDPYTLVILDKDTLEKVKSIPTESRNVGIKAIDNRLFFSLMDKNEVWVIDMKKDFKVIKKIKNIGKMPFDALIDKEKYTVALYDGSIGLLNLKNYKYKNIKIKAGNEVVLKIPHLGFWCSLNENTYLPSVGNKKLLVLKDFKYVKSLDLIGTPVFSVVSPDNIHIAVNYSGDKQDYITIINTKTGKNKDIKVAKRVMHLRFSPDGKHLYVSSFYENKVKVIETENWSIKSKIDIPTPSGIFIY